MLLTKVGAILQEKLPAIIGRTRVALRAQAEGKPFEPVDVEAAVKSVLAAVAPVVVAHLAAEVQGGKVRNQQVCPDCGGALNFTQQRKRTFGFIFGPVRLRRAWFNCPQCHRGRSPLEHVWGLQDGVCAMGRRYLTPRAQVELITLCAALAFNQARERFAEATGAAVSRMTAWRYVQRLGKRLREPAKEGDRAVPFAPGAAPGKGRHPLRWLIGADATKVAFWAQGKRPNRREGGDEPGPAAERGIAWRDVKLAVIALLDDYGKVVAGSQWYVVRLETAELFRKTLRRVAEARGVRQIDVVALVTDCAQWLRALATRHFQWAVAIRDFYHAVEHLGVMGAALYGEESPQAISWQQAMASRLKREGAAALLPEWERIRKVKDRKAWTREMAFFCTQAKEMQYPDFQKAFLPIGSGPLESACKNVVGMRFRLPGARWSEEGFHNLAPIRVNYCNGVPLTG